MAKKAKFVPFWAQKKDATTADMPMKGKAPMKKMKANMKKKAC